MTRNFELTPKKTPEGNLKPPWKSGQSGNLAGRPKGSFSFDKLLRKKLETVPEGSKISFAEAIIEALVKKAVVDEDLSAIKEIINRTDGMPKESIDLNNDFHTVALVEFIKTKSD